MADGEDRASPRSIRRRPFFPADFAVEPATMPAMLAQLDFPRRPAAASRRSVRPSWTGAFFKSGGGALLHLSDSGFRDSFPVRYIDHYTIQVDPKKIAEVQGQKDRMFDCQTGWFAAKDANPDNLIQVDRNNVVAHEAEHVEQLKEAIIRQLRALATDHKDNCGKPRTGCCKRATDTYNNQKLRCPADFTKAIRNAIAQGVKNQEAAYKEAGGSDGDGYKKNTFEIAARRKQCEAAGKKPKF